MKPSFNDAQTDYTDYAKNYCNRTLIVEVIVENVVTCFGDTVYSVVFGIRKVFCC